MIVWLGYPNGWIPKYVPIDSVDVGEYFQLRVGGAVYRMVEMRHQSEPRRRQMEVSTGHVFDLTSKDVIIVQCDSTVHAGEPVGRAKP